MALCIFTPVKRRLADFDDPVRSDKPIRNGEFSKNGKPNPCIRVSFFHGQDVYKAKMRKGGGKPDALASRRFGLHTRAASSSSYSFSHLHMTLTSNIERRMPNAATREWRGAPPAKQEEIDQSLDRCVSRFGFPGFT